MDTETKIFFGIVTLGLSILTIMLITMMVISL